MCAETAPNSQKDVIITFKDKVDPHVIQQLKNLKATIIRVNYNVGSVNARVPQNIIPVLKSQPFVAAVEYNSKVSVTGEVLDWGISKTKPQRAWTNGFTGENIKVAVIDTGIGPHKDLTIAGDVSFIPEKTITMKTGTEPMLQVLSVLERTAMA